MRLFIAEKPSLAKAIFEGLGGNPNTEKKNGYFEHGSDVVTSGVMVICWSFTTHRIMTTNIPTGVIVIYPLKRFIRQNIKSSLNQKHRPALFCLLSIKPTASFIQATPMMKDVCWLMRFWVMPETRNPSSDCLLPTQPCASAKITVEFTT